MTPMVPGVLPAAPAVTPISRLSPSQYGVLMDCTLRASWAAAREPALLPTPPAARLGSAIHALLEEAGRGILGVDAGAVGAAWDRLVAGVEGRMGASWLERALVPLRASVRGYDIRRIRAEDRAARVAAEAMSRPHTAGGTGGGTSVEVWVRTRDGRVGGSIDRVRETAEGPVLLDYKSGAILEQGREATVKKSYQAQLILYAALYAQTFGHWPVRLEIVPLEGPSVEIPYTPDEGQTFLAEAVAVLERADAAIAHAIAASARPHAEQWLANPHPTACGTCPYRPVCRAYHGARANRVGSEWPVDVWGRVAAIRPLGNGRVGLDLESDGGVPARVRALTPGDRHPALAFLQPGDRTALYNLDGRHAPHALSETPLTVLYRYPEARTGGGR